MYKMPPMGNSGFCKAREPDVIERREDLNQSIFLFIATGQVVFFFFLDTYTLFLFFLFFVFFLFYLFTLQYCIGFAIC